MIQPPSRAMVLAAGLGTRMRPLSDALPKPLLPVAGRALLDRALDRLAEAGVAEAVVNTHWKGEAIAAHLAARTGPPRLTLSPETELLETGGGVRRALPLLGTEPFFVVNGDAFWLDGPTPALARLAAIFDAEAMDALLLLYPTARVGAEAGRGDFRMDPLGRLHRRAERDVVPYLYAGVQLVAPTLLASEPEERFSFNRVWDKALAAGRLFGLRHDGLWFHLSTPADIAATEAELAGHVLADAR